MFHHGLVVFVSEPRNRSITTELREITQNFLVHFSVILAKGAKNSAKAFQPQDKKPGRRGHF